MDLSAFSVVEVGFGVLVIEQALGLSQLFSRLEHAVAAFDFIEVYAVFSDADQVHFA